MSLSLFKKTVIALSSALLLQACLGENASGPSQGDVRLNVSTTVPRTQALAKGQLISLSRLVIVLTSNATPADTVRDTITTSTTPSLSGTATADQTVTKTYTLKGLRTWSVTATVYDVKDSIIHQGSAVSADFLKVGDSAAVSLNLSPRFAMYEARFANLPDSISSVTGPNRQVLRINRLVLRVDGVTVRDSTSTGPWFAALSDHVLAYDYVRLKTAATEAGTSPSGVSQLHAIDFANAGDTGIAVGTPYNYRTLDGGLTWTQHTDLVGHPAAEFKYVSYANGGQGLMAGDSTYLIVENNGGIQPAFRQGVLSNTTAGPVAMAGNDTGYALMNSTSPTGATTYRRSLDGGATWGITASYSQNIYGMHCVSASACWAVGHRGVIRKNTSGAGSFSTLLRDTSSSQATLRDVFFLNAGTGWAVGDAGTVLATSNGGTNWSTQSSGTTRRLNGIHFIDASNGYAVGDSGTLLSTVNGGATWSVRASGTTSHLRGLSFSGSRGTIVGSGGIVLRIGGVQTVEMLVYGTMPGWNSANPLFRGTRYIAPMAGVDDAASLTLSWVGPNTGTEKVTVTIGKVGKTTVTGNPVGGVPKRSGR